MKPLLEITLLNIVQR